MADTTFIDQQTVIISAWLNDINDAVYHAIGNGTTAPLTAADVRNNLGMSTTGSTILKGDGAGGITNATGTDITGAIGANPVTNATTATNATNASNVVSGGSIASNVTATTQAASDNSTKVATTAYADAAALAASAVLRGFIDGYIMSTAGSSATMTIGDGRAANSTNAVYINLAAAINKTTSAWAVGSGNGGIDTGSIANNTWYYFYAIRRPDTGVVDVVFSTNSTSPTLPANYTQFRYIGAGRTNASAQWIRFFQTGDDFYWETQVQDLNTATTGTTSVTLSLTIPSGRKMRWYGNGMMQGGGLVRDPATADLVPAATSGNVNIPVSPGAYTSVWTNTSGQIAYRAIVNGTGYLGTVGWQDMRGKNV